VAVCGQSCVGAIVLLVVVIVAVVAAVVVVGGGGVVAVACSVDVVVTVVVVVVVVSAALPCKYCCTFPWLSLKLRSLPVLLVLDLSSGQSFFLSDGVHLVFVLLVMLFMCLCRFRTYCCFVDALMKVAAAQRQVPKKTKRLEQQENKFRVCAYAPTPFWDTLAMCGFL